MEGHKKRHVTKVWLVWEGSDYLCSPWNPKPPMIFQTRESAENHASAVCKNGYEVVEASMIFEAIIDK